MSSVNLFTTKIPYDIIKKNKICYNLLRRSNLYFRKSMISLSKSGNPTAIKVAAEYYVGLGAVDKQENKITFIGVMPEVESDVERMRREQERQQEAVKKAEEGIGK